MILYEAVGKIKISSPVKILCLCFFFFISTSGIFAQVKDSTRAKTTLLPIAFYLPETGFALGATGITTFRFRGESQASRPSQVIYSAAYTFKNLLLFFVPYELYQQEGKKRIKGELGFYKYFYNFYGLGPQSKSSDLEIYNVLFPRIDVNYAKAIGKGIYLGGGFKFDHFDITSIKAGGLLDTQQPIGYQGGRKSNLYGLFFIDTRDNIFASSKGFYFEVVIQKSDPLFFSDFSYTKYDVDFRHFHSFTKHWILASQVVLSVADRSAPFFDLPYISSPNRARGFDDRRFINHQLIGVQTELRYPIFNRFKGVAFLSASHLPDGLEHFFDTRLKWSYGIGLRFELNREEKTRLRLDVARGGGSTNFYITANEAF